MEHPIITLFKPILETGNSDEAMAYMRQHPVLMSPYYTNLLQGFVDTLAESDRSKVLPLMNARAAAFAELRAAKSALPLTSQILDLALKVFEGRYTLEYAETVAAKPEFFVELLYPVITATCEAAEENMHRNWRAAVSILRIVLVALNARGKVIPENQQAMELTTIETWLAVVCTACSDVPDGRIFRDAVARGEAVADIDDKGDPPANIMHRLAVLHLDPYVAGRSSRDLDQQLRDWQTRLYEEYGDRLAGVSREELYMPPIEEALPKAAGYFRRAAARRSGVARGRTLKALAQALNWHSFANVPFDRGECVAAAREALTLLPERFLAERLELNRIIERYDSRTADDPAAMLARARQLFDIPIEEWIKREGALSTLSIFTANADAVSDTDPELGVSLLMAVDELVKSRPEAERRIQDETLIRLATRAQAKLTPMADGTPLGPKLQALFETATREKWPPLKAAYALLCLAVSTTATAQEGEGLEALAFCANVMSRAGSDAVLERTTPFLQAVLQTGAAVNAYDGGNFGEAARLYGNALGGNLDANQNRKALNILRRLLDLSSPGKPEASTALEALVDALVSRSLQLEFRSGDASIALIQTAGQQAMAMLMAERSKLTVMLFVLDFAKGRRFRAALGDSGGAPAWLNDPRTLQTEKEIGRLRSEAGSDGWGNAALLDQNMLLISYVTPYEMKGGATAAEQLRNLQIQFDTDLVRHLGSERADPWIPTLEKLQSLLDDKTVLMIQFIGRNLDRAFTVAILLLTNDDAAAATAVLPEVSPEAVRFSYGEAAARANYLGPPIGELRSRLVSSPGPRAADSRALDALESDYGFFFGGPLKGKLDQFRTAGKDHLCVAPHGPFHFYPFHLLGPEDEPLAADWCVSYLPHPRLLDREPVVDGGRMELTALGVNFVDGNAFGLDPLEDCEDEARAIAGVFGARATLLVGPDATEAAAVEALQRSRRVHISTHGLHNVSAPSFQCIFFNPDAKDDGILNAYELLRLDLRGLELVTFSACETALGRFDVSDNIRGIPAALLIAGVRTIVGTLWNVESNASRHFFTAFYRGLKENASTKKAFLEAQASTRGAFPKYRDWGAFQLIGAWT
jgi:hypothetical protein